MGLFLSSYRNRDTYRKTSRANEAFHMQKAVEETPGCGQVERRVLRWNLGWTDG